MFSPKPFKLIKNAHERAIVCAVNKRAAAGGACTLPEETAGTRADLIILESCGRGLTVHPRFVKQLG